MKKMADLLAKELKTFSSRLTLNRSKKIIKEEDVELSFDSSDESESEANSQKYISPYTLSPQSHFYNSNSTRTPRIHKFNNAMTTEQIRQTILNNYMQVEKEGKKEINE